VPCAYIVWGFVDEFREIGGGRDCDRKGTDRVDARNGRKTSHVSAVEYAAPEHATDDFITRENCRVRVLRAADPDLRHRNQEDDVLPVIYLDVIKVQGR